MDAKIQARRTLELDLRTALAEGQFELFFQPIIDLRSNSVCVLEALLRWNHPIRGRVSPDEFISLAEETGLIVPIGEWVIREATLKATKWPSHINVAVNLSAVQFRTKELLSTVVSALSYSSLAASRLEIEITESVLLNSSALTLSTLYQLRSLGVRVAMDDFGTGHSSLNYLRSFPFDKIKVDRSFAQESSTKEDARAIIRAVAGLGNDLRMTTTAEGVETEEQLAFVRSQGFTEAQGYLFSVPVPVDAISGLLAKLDERAAA